MPPRAQHIGLDTEELVAQLASQWAATIAEAERPAPLSYRDGSVLRLVPANERLSTREMQVNLTQVLAEQQYLLEVFHENVQAASSKSKMNRHLAAWARGYCYLQAANNRQALRDANTAMAYAAAAAPAAALFQTQNTTAATATSNAAVSCSAAGVAAAANSISATSLTNSHSAAAATAASSSPARMPTCTWVPALVLAAEAYTAHADWTKAVLHYAAALQLQQHNTVITGRLTELSVRLPVEQAVAFRTGGLNGLLQQLQLEAEMQMPEVLRPRPKWYYYNKWMTHRIHVALLEYHLGCSLGSGTSQELLDAAQAIADEPAVAAAAAAAGFGGLVTAASSGRAEVENEQTVCAAPFDSSCSSSSSVHDDCMALPGSSMADADHKLGQCTSSDHGLRQCASSDHQQQQLTPVQSPTLQLVAQQPAEQQGGLQLPEPVVSKLLTLDAGDLDLMIQHPQALQAQVYELLDVLESAGPQGVEHHTVDPLSWEEVQGLTGPETVGLPLGYKPTAALQSQPLAKALPGLHDITAATATSAVMALPAAGSATVGQTGELMLRQQVLAADVAVNAAAAAAAAAMQGAVVVCNSARAGRSQGWRQRGLSRSQYLLGSKTAAS